MKKNFIIIFAIFLIIISIVSVALYNAQRNKLELQKENATFEQYKEKEVYGTEVVTVMNKAIDNNEKYNVPKDENGEYIENNEYVIKVNIKLKPSENIYTMEKINSVDIRNFIDNFSLINFKCTQICYHKENGRISSLLFEQIEE